MKSKLANSTSVKSTFAKFHLCEIKVRKFHLGEIKIREFHLGEIKVREFHLGEINVCEIPPQWSQRGLRPRGVRTKCSDRTEVRNTLIDIV